MYNSAMRGLGFIIASFLSLFLMFACTAPSLPIGILLPTGTETRSSDNADITHDASILDTLNPGGMLSRIIDLRIDQHNASQKNTIKAFRAYTDCDAKSATEATRILAKKNVAAVISTICSTATLAAAPVLAQKNIPLISATARSKKTANKLANKPANKQSNKQSNKQNSEKAATALLFRTSTANDAEARVIMQLIKHLALKKILVLLSSEQYSAEILSDIAAQGSMREYLEIFRIDTETSTEDIASRIAFYSADGVLLLSSYLQTKLVQDLQNRQYTGALILGSMHKIASPAIHQLTQNILPYKLYLIEENPAQTRTQDPSYKAFASDYQQHYARALMPQYYKLIYSTEAAISVLMSIASTHARTSSDILKALQRNTKFETLLGEIFFDSNGEIRSPQMGYSVQAY